MRYSHTHLIDHMIEFSTIIISMITISIGSFTQSSELVGRFHTTSVTDSTATMLKNRRLNGD